MGKRGRPRKDGERHPGGKLKQSRSTRRGTTDFASMVLYGKPTSCVYVIEADGTHSIKIGVSDNPASRCASMQTGSKDKLVLYWAGRVPVESVFSVERVAHDILKSERRHMAGEWFSCGAAYARNVVMAAAARIGVTIQDDIAYDFRFRQEA